MKNKSIFNENYFKILDCLENAGYNGVSLQEKFDLSEKVFLKHIANLRKVGFKITKKNNKYYYDKFLNSLSLNDVEKSLLAHILTLSETYLNKKKYQNVEELIKKIAHLSSSKNYEEILEKFLNYKKIEFFDIYNERINLLNEYIEKKEEIVVTLRSKKEYEFTANELVWKNNRIYVKYLENDKAKSLSIEKIVKITPKNEPKENIRSQEVFFELYGHLAKSYLLKADERVVDIYPDRIVIANSQKDKNLLFRRFLRYDTLCKVILGKADVEHFKNLITNAINNLSTLDFETT